MKKLLFLAIFLISSIAKADPLLLEGIFDAELLLDYKQTQTIPGWCIGRQNCTLHETNPILGREPSQARIRNYFITSAIVHGAISYALPTEYRKYWQTSTIVVEGFVVAHNRYIGLKINF